VVSHIEKENNKSRYIMCLLCKMQRSFSALACVKSYVWQKHNGTKVQCSWESHWSIQDSEPRTTVEHILSCACNGFPSTRHNELLDLTSLKHATVLGLNDPYSHKGMNNTGIGQPYQRGWHSSWHCSSGRNWENEFFDVRMFNHMHALSHCSLL